ncbi:MAG: SRPBCC family protein [Thermoplasmatota archaeon]|nr:SRPBCC family protein [Halobacteriales archaeon]
MAMKGFTMEQQVPAPPKAVFAVLSDLSQARDWMPAITSIEPITDGPLAEGSKWTETRTTSRGPFTSTIEVTEFVPDRTFALRAENRKAELTFRFNLQAEGKGTKVTTQSSGRLKGLMAPFSGKLVKEMQSADADILERLAAQVGKGATAKAKTAPKTAKQAKSGKAKKTA